MYHLGDLTDSVTDFMATDIASTIITLSWSPPTALVPISYEIEHRCRRLCESFASTERGLTKTRSRSRSRSRRCLLKPGAGPGDAFA